MIEKEKMLRGELYNSSSDKDLVEDRERAKDLCFELNNTKPSDLEKRKNILKTSTLNRIFGVIMDIELKSEKISTQITM